MLFANGCDGFVITPQKQELKRIQNEKIVVVAPEHDLIFSKKTGFKKNAARTGIDFDLIQSFSNFSGYEVSFLSFPTREKALAAFEAGQGDLLIGRWPSLRNVPGTIDGPIFENSKFALYCPKKLGVANAKDLSIYTVYMRFIDSLAFQNQRPPLYPQFKIVAIKGSDSDILSQTLSSSTGCAIVEERLGDFEIKFYPQIEKVYTFGFDLNLTWKIREGKSELFNSLRQWFQLASRQNLVVPVISRYTSSVGILDESDFSTFQRNTFLRLKSYLALFRSAANQAHIPWTLLAAVGYQESHLDNEAVSFTGVQGIMQITQSTASFLGLSDRTNPTEAIPAAAKYLGWIFEFWPKDIPYIERVRLTLASYNMGYQHVLDVQDWLLRNDMNPYSWTDLKTGFAKKADAAIAHEFALGTARGHETIDFVERVLAFEHLFKRAYTTSPKHVSNKKNK